MAYQQSASIQYGDFGDTGTPSNLRLNNSKVIWEGRVIRNQIWGPDLVFDSSKPQGNVIIKENSFDLTMFCNAAIPDKNVSSWIESPYHLPSSIGNSSICIFSFNGFVVSETSLYTKRIGLYHQSSFMVNVQKFDGCYFLSDKTGVRFIVSDQNTTYLSINQSNWLRTEFADPQLIDFTKPQIGWIAFDYSHQSNLRIRAGFFINGQPRTMVDESLPTPSSTFDFIRNQKFRMEISAPAFSRGALDTFTGFSQSYMIEGETTSHQTFTGSIKGVTAPADKTTMVLGFKVPVGPTGPIGDYWSFNEIESISVSTYVENDTSILYLLYLTDEIGASANWFQFPNFGYNLTGVMGASAVPLHWSNTKKDISSYGSPPPTLLYSCVLGVEGGKSNVQTIKIPKGLARPGYLHQGGTSAINKVGTIWVAIQPTVNDIEHDISVNWRCIS